MCISYVYVAAVLLRVWCNGNMFVLGISVAGSSPATLRFVETRSYNG